MLKKIIYVLLAMFIVAQFVRPAKNISSTTSPNDITAKYAVPDGVKASLSAACYDCHSNNTKYPWYANIQPVGWWLANHVNEGKHELNFSEFLTYPPKKAKHKLEEAKEAITEHWMPLKSYLIMHPEGKLTDAQTKEMADWITATMSQIEVPAGEESKAKEHEEHH